MRSKHWSESNVPITTGRLSWRNRSQKSLVHTTTLMARWSVLLTNYSSGIVYNFSDHGTSILFNDILESQF